MELSIEGGESRRQRWSEKERNKDGSKKREREIRGQMERMLRINSPM